MCGDAPDRIKRRRRAAKKTNPAERTATRRPIARAPAAAADSRSSSPRGHRILSTCLYYAFLRALSPASLRPRGMYARVRTCGRAIRAVRGVSAVYAVEDIPRRRITRGRRGEGYKGDCIPVGLFCFEPRKGCRDGNVVFGAL